MSSLCAVATFQNDFWCRCCHFALYSCLCRLLYFNIDIFFSFFCLLSLCFFLSFLYAELFFVILLFFLYFISFFCSGLVFSSFFFFPTYVDPYISLYIVDGRRETERTEEKTNFRKCGLVYRIYIRRRIETRIYSFVWNEFFLNLKKIKSVFLHSDSIELIENDN